MTPPHHWWHQWPEWTNLRTQLNNPAQSKAKVHYKALVRWTKAPFQQNHATHFKFLPCNFTTLCIRVSHNITLCIVIEVFKSFQATFQILSWTLPDNQNSATMPFKLANLGARCPATIPGRIWLNSQNATHSKQTEVSQRLRIGASDQFEFQAPFAMLWKKIYAKASSNSHSAQKNITHQEGPWKILTKIIL